MGCGESGLAQRRSGRYCSRTDRPDKEVRVSRPLVHTRIAEHTDLPTLLALWDELRGLGGRAERALNPTAISDVDARLGEVLDDPLCRVVLACSDGVAVGMAIMTVTRPDPLSDTELVHLAHIVVSRGQRQHGIGRALIAAAVEFATERHIDHLTASIYPSLRETSRFFARIGFAPAAVNRVAPVATLRRRLEADGSMPLLGTAVRRRTRLLRPAATQQSRRISAEPVDH
jgi:GNAT superfamily N-acetyltransferase